MTVVALSTGLRRGELLGIRWMDLELLEKRLSVRQAFVLGEMSTPKSRAGRRTLPLGPVAIEALGEQFTASRYREPESIVFCHEALRTPLDPSKLSGYARAAMKAAGIDKPFRVWHGLRHTALTETAAAGSRRCSYRRRPDTLRARRRSGTSTQTGRRSRRLRSSPRLGCSPPRTGRRSQVWSHVGRSENGAAFFLWLPLVLRSSPGWTRTNNPSVNSRMLCQLSYRGKLGGHCSPRRVPSRLSAVAGAGA